MSTSTDGPLDGISGAFDSEANNIQLVLIIFIVLSLYNVVELVVLILFSFHRRRGLYFWSLFLSTTLGVFPYSLGFLLKFFTNISPFISVTVLSAGWWVMVTGQGLVLYSRLHLVLRDQRILRRVLYMILANILLLHVPTTVLTYGSNVNNPTPTFIKAYNIMEKIQMTGFTIQEGIISGLYVYETMKILRAASQQKRENRKIMQQLVGINVIIIIMDLTLLGLEYASEYAIQITFKGAVYSLKLKLEFAVLGKLVDFVRLAHAKSANSLHLGSLRYHGDQGAGVPSTRADDPHFYGETTADAAVRPPQSSSEERLNIPLGMILTKTEFSTSVEDRPPPEYDRENLR
ncbi:hypothetical protein VTN77DRAFT_4822 [Rasamsonia byssochlamydoides]|uniref:uncharacterized protein n=1 Tax=Rasamsonia byssochlamydoides TaxID=89139 RepID=UPI0037445D01